jgi:hypothetical protein
MAPEMVTEAFNAEAQRLSEVVTGTEDAAFARPTTCTPWTVAELLYHVRMAIGRLPVMLTAPEPPGIGLVSAAAQSSCAHASWNSPCTAWTWPLPWNASHG